MDIRNFLQNEYMPHVQGRGERYNSLAEQYLRPQKRNFLDYALPAVSAISALIGSGSGGKAANVLGMLSGLSGGAYQGMNDARTQQRDQQFNVGLQGMGVEDSAMNDMYGAYGQMYDMDRDDVKDDQWQQDYNLKDRAQGSLDEYRDFLMQPDPVGGGSDGDGQGSPSWFVKGAPSSVNEYNFGNEINARNRQISAYNQQLQGQPGLGAMSGGVDWMTPGYMSQLPEFMPQEDQGVDVPAGVYSTLLNQIIAAGGGNDEGGNPLPPDLEAAWNEVIRITNAGGGVPPQGGMGGGYGPGGGVSAQGAPPADFDSWDDYYIYREAYNKAMNGGQ